MYPNLEKALKEKRFTRTALAAYLGVDVKTITNKMEGRRGWWLDEVTKIRELFPEYTQEWLFYKEEPEAAAV